MTEHEQLSAILAASNGCARYKHEPDGADVWRTPAELAESGVGDCEDFAIDALFRIQAAGLPGTARLGCCAIGSGGNGLMHMVCLYRPAEGDDPWVLDVAIDYLLRLSERHHLTVMYELGLDGIFGGGRRLADVDQSTP